MEELKFQLCEGEQLLEKLDEDFRDFQKLARAGTETQREANKKLLESIEELIEKRSPPAEWNAELSARFLMLIGGLTRTALKHISGPSESSESLIRDIQTRADLLCSLAAAMGNQVEERARLHTCGVWALSHLVPLRLTGPQLDDFVAETVSALSVVGLPREDLRDQVVTQVVLQVSTYADSGEFDESSIEHARTWYHELSQRPKVKKLVALARTFRIEEAGERNSSNGFGPHSTVLEVNVPNEVVAVTTTDYAGREIGLPPVTNVANVEVNGNPNSVAAPTTNTVENAPEPEITPPAKATPKALIRRWEQPFRFERDVNNSFLQNVDELLRRVDGSSVNKSAIDALNHAKFQYEKWKLNEQHRGPSNVFLVPAVRSAVQIAEVFLKEERPYDAFWTSNIFAEMAKILTARNPTDYKPIFEQLLQIACHAISDTWEEGKLKETSAASEIQSLSTHLINIISEFALGTYFLKKESRFVRGGHNVGVDALEDQLVNEAVARHFDKRLRYLLQFEGPRVRDYVMTSMPFVYRLKLSKHWDSKREQWERLLESSGYAAEIRLLKDMGDLIRESEVGQLTDQQRDNIERAASNNDLVRVAELLADSAKELRSYLYRKAQSLLVYREPEQPYFSNAKLSGDFLKGQRLSKTDDPEKMERALAMVRNIWQREIGNNDLRDWVAYLLAKTGNGPAAERMLRDLQNRRAPKRNFITEWNLAVRSYDRKEEGETYQLLLPLIDEGSLDEDLILVTLALSLKLNDAERFLSIVPKTMSLRFHPLAFVIANGKNDKSRAENLLAQLLSHWQGKWELPPPSQRLNYKALENIVNRAIVEGQIEQLVGWLEARIKLNRGYVPNYLSLARVLEEEVQPADVDGAFRILRDRYEMERGRRPREQTSIDEACEDMLNFSKKQKRQDLGQQAYKLSLAGGARSDLLAAFEQLAPREEDSAVEHANEQEEKIRPPLPLPSTLGDPKIAERLAWAVAQLAGIRTVAAYIKQLEVIEGFSKIVEDWSPQESTVAVELIRNTSARIESFAHTDPGNHDARRTLYDRVTDYEKRLSELLKSGALSTNLTNVITPYRQSLRQVVGDLSRLAGVAPAVEVNIENPFISLEASRSTLVVRLTNKSERAINDIVVELASESGAVSIASPGRESRVTKLDSSESTLLSVTLEVNETARETVPDEVVFAISLRASAEGFPNVELGLKKPSVPIKTLKQVIGFDQIPKLFQEGPLKPSAPELFHGRNTTLNDIKNSFYGGIQRERYFFDGIRRVGKTSILNFLPLSLPDDVIPVLINFDKWGLGGRFNSAVALRHFCTLIAKAVADSKQVMIEIPTGESFEHNPGEAFEVFLKTLSASLPGHKPLLMIDEFQDLLVNIAASGSGNDRDTLVLKQLRAHLDDGRIYAIFTGSVRFDRLSDIVDHRIIGSLKRLPVSFLSKDSVAQVLRAGLCQWVILPPETVDKVYALTGGYPWLVQKYGLELVNVLNAERRTVATPEDVDAITNERIVWDDTLFAFWWPADQLRSDEERFIERIFRNYGGEHPIPIREFFADIRQQEQQSFRQALANLRACEVLDSTQTEVLRFSGAVLRQWLKQQLQDGQLRMRSLPHNVRDHGQAGIFIDHENLLKSLERIAGKRGVDIPADRGGWLSEILDRLLSEAEKRVGPLWTKVTVAFWDRPHEAAYLSAYFAHGFNPQRPEEVKANAVDFKVADEARRARERAMREGTSLSRAIIVSGDGDYSQVAQGLKHDGVTVQIWGGSRETNKKYKDIVGEDNIVVLDDVCGI